MLQSETINIFDCFSLKPLIFFVITLLIFFRSASLTSDSPSNGEDILTSLQENSYYDYSTAFRKHMRIVVEEMSSWTPLTMYLGMRRQHFRPNMFKANMSGFLLWWFLIFKTLHENAYLHWIITKTQYYELFLVESCISLNMHFSSITQKFSNPHNKSPNIFAWYIFGLKCCLHPLDTLLKASNTTSPQKLFAYDCVMLYIIQSVIINYVDLIHYRS